jgi:hypothetical protein
MAAHSTTCYVAPRLNDPGSDYFLEIEAHFIQRRSSPLPPISGKDWALMKQWAEEGVPLPLIIEAIDAVFDRAAEKGSEKPISTLRYVKHAVAKLWKERKEMSVGGREETPEEDVSGMLDALAGDLAAATAPPAVLEPMSARIRELARLRSVPKVEEQLIELERELIEQVVATLSAAELDALRAEVARVVGDPSKLSEKARARTEEANLRRLVRERFELPRLTLFR